MSLVELDLFVRVGAVTTLLLLAWLLFRQRRALGTPAWLFPPLALCLSSFVIGNTPDPSLVLSGTAADIASFASGFTVIFLWWFSLSCFESRFRPRGAVLAGGIVWALLAALDRGLFGAAAADIGLSRALVLLGFLIVGHVVWRLVSDRKDDLIQRRHDARIMVAVLLGGELLVDLAADVMFGFAWRPLGFALAQNVSILGFGLWLAASVLAVRPHALTFVEPAAAPAPAVAGLAEDENAITDDALRRRLSALLEQDRVYLDPELTFAAFVRRMQAPQRVVRKLVNHELGFDHFRSFLNHYRMMEACRRLGDPGKDGDKLIAVALDSGFASLASFNRVFRAAQGCTPSEYRDAARAGRSRSESAGMAAKPPSSPGFEERSAVF